MTYEKIVELAEKAYSEADASKIPDLVAVELDVVGEGEGAFYIEVKNGNLTVMPFEYYDRTAKVIAPSSVLISILEGDLTFEQAYNNDSIRIYGSLNSLFTLDQIKPKKDAKKSVAKKAAVKSEKKASEKKTAAKKTTVKKTASKKAAK